MTTAQQITEAQELHLRLIEAVGVSNKLDGPAVADSLRLNRQFWRAAVIAREIRVTSTAGTPQPLAARVSLLHLRDLPENHVNLDTVFVLATSGSQDELEALAQTWNPDELRWFNVKEACQAMGEAAIKHRSFGDPSRFLMKVWWD